MPEEAVSDILDRKIAAMDGPRERLQRGRSRHHFVVAHRELERLAGAARAQQERVADLHQQLENLLAPTK